MTNGVFRKWWQLFMQRWDRAEQAELTAFYLAELRYMTDEQFETVARKALRSMTYFPTIEELEQIITGTKSNQAAIEWERVQGLLSNSAASLDSLDSTARRCVRSMGGLSQIGSDVKAMDFKRKAFIEMYADLGEGNHPQYLQTEQSKRLIEQAMGGTK